MPHPDGLSHSVLQPGPRSPVGAEIAVHRRGASERPVVALGDGWDEPGARPEVPGVEDVDAGTSGERGDVGPSPFDEPPGAQEASWRC